MKRFTQAYNGTSNAAMKFEKERSRRRRRRRREQGRRERERESERGMPEVVPLGDLIHLHH